MEKFRIAMKMNSNQQFAIEWKNYANLSAICRLFQIPSELCEGEKNPQSKVKFSSQQFHNKKRKIIIN
jgi:hypothetical protein